MEFIEISLAGVFTDVPITLLLIIDINIGDPTNTETLVGDTGHGEGRRSPRTDSGRVRRTPAGLCGGVIRARL